MSRVAAQAHPQDQPEALAAHERKAVQGQADDEALRLLSAVKLFSPLDADSLAALARSMDTVTLEPGAILMRQGERGDSMFIVASGLLRALVAREDGVQREVGRIRAGMPVGEIQIIAGGHRSATVEAVEMSRLWRLPQRAYDLLAERTPAVAEELATVVRERLHRSQLAALLPEILGPLEPDVLLDLEKKIEWISLRRGEALFRQGDACDGWYVVVSGNLQVVRTEPNGHEVVLGTAGRGESLGEVAIFTGERRSATPYALRDTQLIRFDNKTFEEIMVRYPRILLSITNVLIKRLRTSSGPNPRRQRNVVVLPAGPGASAADFARRLAAALSAFGRTLHVSAERLAELGVLDNASRIPDAHPNWLRFVTWLEEQTASHEFILLEADARPTGWSRRVLRQADQVLIVADAADGCAPGENELELLRGDTARERRARQTLVLVHPPDTRLPRGTHEWLLQRSVDAHHHVRAGSDADIRRVARLLAGRAVGLALGGGGARGFAHIGVVRALREHRIPIDFIGGTSMGAIVAGQVALGLTHEEMLEKNRQVIALKPFSEFTIPLIAMLKTNRVERGARLSFGDVRIEDLWINYFAVSSNLTTAEMVVHDRGPVWEATRASGSLPGVLVPFVLGRQLLVDGGVVNNVPGDVMRARCDGGPVIAVNVSPEEDLAIGPSGLPSQWELLLSTVLPHRRKVRAPRIMDILMRTTMLASSHRAQQVQRNVDLYLRPPIDRYGMLDFDQIEAIIMTGYVHAKKAAAGWTGPREQ